MSINGGPYVPTNYERDEQPHVCGKCRTPWGVSNPNCPNAPRPS